MPALGSLRMNLAKVKGESTLTKAGGLKCCGFCLWSSIFCLGMIVSSFPLYAEIITLKTGKTVEGNITEKGDSFVKVDMDGIVLTYYFDQIETIDGKKAMSPVTQEGPAIKDIAPQEGKKIFKNWEWKYSLQYPERWEVIPTAERKGFSMGFQPKGKNRELVTIELYRENISDEQFKKTATLNELLKTLSVAPELKKESEEPLEGAKIPGYFVRYTNKLPFTLNNV